MKMGYNRLPRFIALLLIAAIALVGFSACTLKLPWANDAAVEGEGDGTKQTESTLPPANKQPTPTPKITPEPTITPRPIDMAVETAAPGSTPLLIEPIDKPKRTFVYAEYTSTSLGLTFNVPGDWIETALDDETVMFSEPPATAMDGFPAELIVKCVHNSSNQESEDAISALNGLVESLKIQYPNVEMSLRADNNKILGEPGYYYNFRVAQENAKAIRGRVVVAAANRLLISVQLLAPAGYYTDYLDIVREVRTSIKQ
ncbi:MAG: hypothetical protein LBB86_04560 [Oscillospiraceae bacterium]|jgi:hypothetical protein|nr:hypothetical protein [Oscillospiraceae bacterium]